MLVDSGVEARRRLAEAQLLDDAEVVHRVRGGDPVLFELLMRRHNQRVYRAVRSVIRNDAEIEEVMQQAYLNAYAHLHQFEGSAQFSTWLVRIALNEALARRRKNRPHLSTDDPDMSLEASMPSDSAPPTPEAQVESHELTALLEAAIESLPDLYRTTFVLREVEGLSTTETALAEGTNENVVKQRLHRARAFIRRQLTAQVGAALGSAFPFDARRCDRVVAAVLANIT